MTLNFKRSVTDLGSGDSLTSWEGRTELLLAKVKNAPGRIGIFGIYFCQIAYGLHMEVFKVITNFSKSPQ